MQGRILIVDDQADQAAIIREVAEGMGHTVVATDDPRQAVPLYHAERPNLVILDIVMPTMDGIEIMKALGAAGCTAPVLMVSGYNPRYLENAEKLGAPYGVRVTTRAKPLSISVISECIAHALSSSLGSPR